LESLDWKGHLFVRNLSEESDDNSCPQPNLPRMRQHRLWSRSLTPVHRLMHRIGLETDHMPDDALPWALRASLSTVRVRASELMITISHPLSTHITGLLTKRARPRLPWITYFSDPWSEWGDVEFRKSSNRSQNINRWLEQRVIRHADGLIFPSQELAEHFQSVHPIMQTKVVGVVPQSYDPALYPPPQRQHRADELLIRSVGDFYGPRSPRPLLDALQIVRQRWPELLSKLKIEFYGRFDCNDKPECLELMTTLPVEHHGHVSYERSLELMVESDVLINLDVITSAKYFRPSKLIHYLGAGRPMIGVSSDGAGSHLVERSGGFVASPKEPEEIAQVLRQVCELHAAGRLASHGPPAELMAEFTPAAAAARFSELAIEVIDRVKVSRQNPGTDRQP
jgi:glycosyltransferase involved in cell wall biosynthesis